MKADDIKTTAKDLGSTASKSGDDIKKAAGDTASSLGSKAESLSERAAETANDLYGRAKDKLQDAAGDFPDSASEALAAGQRAYGQGRHQLARQLARQPVEALLLAGAIGYLVGWATTR